MPIIRLASQQWLQALLSADIELMVCRYNARQGPWLHQHTDTQHHFLSFVEQGVLRFQVGKQSIEVAAGELLWMQPGVERAVCGTAEGASVRHINLRVNISAKAQALACEEGFYHIRAAQPLRHYLTEMLEYVEAASTEVFPQLHLKIICSHLCHDALVLSQRAAPAKERGLSAAQRQQLQRFVVDHMSEALSPADLAAQMELSLDYFTRCFRRSYGLAPRQYLVEERMRQAAIQLIDSQLSIGEVAESVGLADANYFCRQFKKVIGTTPGKFRQGGILPKQYA